MNEKNCRLCLQTVCNNNYQVVGESLLKTLKLDLKISKETVMCVECANSVQVFTKFTPGCVRMGDGTLPVSDLQSDAKLDPVKIEATSNLHSLKKTEIKCNFCTEVHRSEDLISLNDANENRFMVNMLEQYISETNLNNTEELLACVTCLEALEGVLGVILRCLEVEKTISAYIKLRGTDDKGQIELKDVQQFLCRPMLTLEIEPVGVNESEGGFAQIQEETTTAEVAMKYKKEISHPELIIKAEGDDEIESEQSDITDTKSEQSDGDGLQETDIENEVPKDPLPISVVTSEKRKCDERIKRHLVIPLQPLLLTHKSPSKIKTFKCASCTYEAIRKDHLVRHLLTHESRSVTKMFKCSLCSYKTKRKSDLETHLLNHKKPSKMKSFKCALCPYEAKRKTDLKRHVLIHQSPSKIIMFKCASCSYEAKRKDILKYHFLIHQSPSRIETFKCAMCSYEAKRKYHLIRHLLSHKSPPEIFKCKFCSYEVRHKSTFTNHLLTHKSPSERNFKCATCSYETKRKSNIKTHLLNHKRSSKNLIRCEMCSYEAKSKYYLDRHLLMHKSPSALKMFKCAICSYQAKRKDHLERHSLTHKHEKKTRFRNNFKRTCSLLVKPKKITTRR